jgi:hypothetical protein
MFTSWSLSEIPEPNGTLLLVLGFFGLGVRHYSNAAKSTIAATYTRPNMHF